MADRADGRALLIYDGECAFCRAAVGIAMARTGDRVVYAASQEIARNFPDIPSARFRRSVQLIDVDGRRHEGAQAVFRTLAHAPGQGWLRRLYEAPLVAPMSEAAYRFVARHRGSSFRVMRLLWGPKPDVPRHARTAAIFLRLLPLAYLFAFLSWLSQLPGLIGADGLLPAGPSADAWQAMALIGAIMSLVAFAGRFRAPMLLAAWVLYALITVGAGEFTLRGDALLLEAGFLALFLVPFRIAADAPSAASPTVVWLCRFLLFRAFLSMALSRLVQPGADGASALALRLETQPLPAPLAWHAHNLPDALLAIASVAGWLITAALPFLFLLPRRARVAAAPVAAAFAVMTIATRNEGLFGWMLIALCLFLVDDAVLERLFRGRSVPPVPPAPETRRWVRGLAVAFGILGLAVLVSPLVPGWRLTSWLATAAVSTRIVGTYGTPPDPPAREQLVFEGSDDGIEWKEYRLRHAPGDVKRAPRFIAPFQPRLDPGLRLLPDDAGAPEPLIRRLAQRLLEGSRPVNALFRSSPFPEAPPRLVRAVIYRYRFTSPEERTLDGSWWRRSLRAELLPPTVLNPAGP